MSLFSVEAPAPPHPAKYSNSILAVFAGILAQEVERRGKFVVVLDPMAGTGRIHELATADIHTCGVELEPEWAANHPMTQQGDATNLPAEWTGAFNVTMSSPPYANRMADTFDARDDSKRMTYKHQLGRDLSTGSGAGLQWGDAYRSFGRAVLDEMVRVTAPGGLVVINVSNHIRNRREQLVSQWWLGSMIKHGLRPEQEVQVSTPRMGFGQNREARVQNEWVFVTRKAA